MAKDETGAIETEVTKFGFGTIGYVKGTPGRPKTTEVEGNVTTHNHAIAPTSGFFDVSFTVQASVKSHRENGQAEGFLSLSVGMPILCDDPQGAEYLQIEDAAAHELPGILRSIAEQIEAENERATARRTLKPEGQ